MKVKKLIKQLQKMNPEAKIVVTGAYGAIDNKIWVEEILEENRENFHVDASDYKAKGIVCISSRICSG